MAFAKSRPYKPKRRFAKKFKSKRSTSVFNHPKLNIMPAMASAGSNQMASIIETKQYSDIQPNTANNYIFSLGQFQRAAQLSTNYQFYRAKRVIWQYTPLYNVFQESSVGASPAKPYMYTVMNRIQDVNIDGNILSGFQQMGARGKAFAKTVKISYTPNWTTPGLPAIQVLNGQITRVFSQGLQKCYNWIATSATCGQGAGAQVHDTEIYDNSSGWLSNAIWDQGVTYNGHTTYFDQSNSTSSIPICRLTCTVHWEFKGARVSTQNTSPPPPTSATFSKVVQPETNSKFSILTSNDPIPKD